MACSAGIRIRLIPTIGMIKPMFMTHLPIPSILVENELGPILPGLVSIVCQDDSCEGQRFIKAWNDTQPLPVIVRFVSCGENQPILVEGNPMVLRSRGSTLYVETRMKIKQNPRYLSGDVDSLARCRFARCLHRFEQYRRRRPPNGDETGNTALQIMHRRSRWRRPLLGVYHSHYV
jgi:hypothetical protein